MMSIPTFRLVLCVTAATFLAGCISAEKPRMERLAEPVRIEGAQRTTPEAADASAPASAAPSTAPSNVRIGSGRVINERVAAAPPPNLSSSGEATFNFEGSPVQVVVKAVLGDLLQQNYVIAPGVQGTVTLNTPRPVNPAQALSLLEMVLGWNNARMVYSDGRYNIVPADKALQGNLSPRSGSPANARGFEVRAVPLKFISATEMEKLLKPYARDNAVVQVDTARNMIVLAGTRAELQNYLRTVDIFDVDWLAGMSVGIFPLQSSQAAKVVGDLEKTFGEGSKTPLAGMFRFMPLEGQNAVMVITPQPKYLRDIESWIDRMDAGGDGARLYVHEVKNVKAKDLAEQLNVVFGGGSVPSTEGSGGALMPSLEPVEVRTTDTPVQNAQSNTVSRPRAGAGGDSGVSISAVEENNSLLVRANPSQWESIRRAIERLDIMPLQVHIEAQVVEVKLVDTLEYGVSWFFGNEVDSDLQPVTSALDDVRNYGSRVTPGGSSFTFLGPSAQAVISTLDELTDLRVLSAPSVLVRNNVEADFSSGTQIPVASTIINNNGNTNNDNTFSQVQFRQTGVSLKVKPRVSSNGMVFLEISQEVSSPSPDTPSSPTIGGNVSVDNRKLKTEVAVPSGETVVLAGLIKTETGRGSAGFPGLSRLPFVGALFGTQERRNDRVEVLVLVTPKIVRDPTEARRLTDEYGERFRALEPLREDARKSGKP